MQVLPHQGAATRPVFCRFCTAAVAEAVRPVTYERELAQTSVHPAAGLFGPCSRFAAPRFRGGRRRRSAGLLQADRQTSLRDGPCKQGARPAGASVQHNLREVSLLPRGCPLHAAECAGSVDSRCELRRPREPFRLPCAASIKVAHGKRSLPPEARASSPAFSVCVCVRYALRTKSREGSGLEHLHAAGEGFPLGKWATWHEKSVFILPIRVVSSLLRKRCTRSPWRPYFATLVPRFASHGVPILLRARAGRSYNSLSHGTRS